MLVHPLARGLEIDDPRTTEVWRTIVQQKGFLRRLYEDWYEQVCAALPGEDRPVLELGSGAGFLRQYIPGLITSEVLACSGVSLALDGQRMPFRDASLGAIVMTDVLHHLPRVREFMHEAARCVRPGGRMVLVEPWVTAWSRLVYTHVHPEPLLPAAKTWEFPSSGPVSGANVALPWILFERDRCTFEREFAEWRIAEVRLSGPFRYLLSGGLTRLSLAPGWAFDGWRALEGALAPWMGQLAMFARIVLERQACEAPPIGMLVLLRSLELFAFLTALGLPINLVLLPSMAFGQSSGCAARWLLAPVTGLAILVVYASMFFALGVPVSLSAGPAWLLVVAAWAVWMIAGWRTRRRWAWPWALVRAQTLRSWSVVLLGLLGLALSLSLYAWPFIQDGQIEFWHFAGSDGYMYMSIAEYVGAYGSHQTPVMGPYVADYGFLGSVLEHFQDPTRGQGEKPGTFASHATIAGILGLTTHQAFSPMVLVSMALLYIGLWLAGAALRLEPPARTILALLGCVSPFAWLIANYTFLANVLTLHLFPILLLVIPRPGLSVRVAAYGGLLLAAEILLYPDSTIALAGMLVPWLLLLVWRTRGWHQRRAVLASLGAALVVMLVLIAPMGGYLTRTALGRLNAVILVPTAVKSPLRSVLGSDLLGAVPDVPRQAGPLFLQPLPKWDWVWPALNLNVLPPEPLHADEEVFWRLLNAAVLAYLAWWAWRRRSDVLGVYLVLFCVLLGLGAFVGLLRGDYELFRALGVFGFIPLAAVVVLLQRALLGIRAGWRQLVPRLAIVGVSAVLLAHFAQNDLRQFQFGFSAHLPDAQYVSSDFVDRAAVANLARGRTLVLVGEASEFTDLTRELMLFSAARPGVPNSFYKFYFAGYPLVPKNVQYEADLALTNHNYPDVFTPEASASTIYSSEGFSLLENDLVPFFDTDTLPKVNPFPAALMRRANLVPARRLSSTTAVSFNNRIERDVSASLEFVPEQHPASIAVSVDQAATRTVALPADGPLELPLGRLTPGLHTLFLAAPAAPAQLSHFSLRGAP